MNSYRFKKDDRNMFVLYLLVPHRVIHTLDEILFVFCRYRVILSHGLCSVGTELYSEMVCVL